MKKLFIALVLVLSFAEIYASELQLQGRLLLQDTKFGWDENTPATHSRLKSGYTIGVAMFDNGSVAEKTYVYAQNNRENDGSLAGYSLYTFPNGDSLLFEFDATWDESGLKAIYPSVIKGTGKFEGATGSGIVTGVAGPWYETIMADVILELKLLPQ